jgi:ethanolaminephosphotransferase
VIRARRSRGESSLKPLLGLLPFAVHTVFQVAYLYGAPFILRRHLVAFSLSWGLAFAYQVGLLIVAHVTKSSFPKYHYGMVLSFIGAVDANAQRLFGVRPLINRDAGGQLLWTYGCLIVAAVMHAFFIWDVVGTVCAYFDINCLTLKKNKDKEERKERLPVFNADGDGHLMATIPEERVIKKKMSRRRLAN